MKPDQEYRSADTWVGTLLGAFIGGVIGITLWFENLAGPKISPLFLIGASAISGGITTGALAFLLGKRFTDAVESFIATVREFFRHEP